MVEPTADIAWALVLAAARRLREGITLAESGSWRGYEPDLLLGHRLTGGTLLVVGAGRIGAAVARRSIGWGMTVLYTARSEKTASSRIADRRVTRHSRRRSPDRRCRGADHEPERVDSTPDERADHRDDETRKRSW